jgi:hypothetical protein
MPVIVIAPVEDFRERGLNRAILDVGAVPA